MKTLKQIFALVSITALVANPITGYCANHDYFQNYLNQQSEQTQPAYTPAWQPVQAVAEPWSPAAYTTMAQQPTSPSAAIVAQVQANQAPQPFSTAAFTTPIQLPSFNAAITNPAPATPAAQPSAPAAITTTAQQTTSPSAAITTQVPAAVNTAKEQLADMRAAIVAQVQAAKVDAADMRAAIIAQVQAAKVDAADMRAAIIAQVQAAKVDAADMRAALLAQANAKNPLSLAAYTATLSTSNTLPTLPGSINPNLAANTISAENIGMLQYALRQELIQSKYNFGGSATGTPPNMNQMLQLASIMVAGYKAEHPDATPVYMTINGKKVEVTGLGKEQYVNTPGGIMRSETPISGNDPSKWTANDLPFLVGITSYSDLQADYQDGDEFGVKFVGTAGHVTFGEDTVRSRKLGNTDPIPATTRKTDIQAQQANQAKPEQQTNQANQGQAQTQTDQTIKTSAPCKIGDAYGAEKSHGEQVEKMTANPDGTWSIETNLGNKYRLAGITETTPKVTTNEPTPVPQATVSSGNWHAKDGNNPQIGDITTTQTLSDGTVITTYKYPGGHDDTRNITTYPDGTVVTTKQNGTIITSVPVITRPDGDMDYVSVIQR